MCAEKILNKALSWEELSKLSTNATNHTESTTNPYSILRLFGKSEKDARVTLYRDHHAWCPYCQKVWLWLEWKQIPYRTKKVTMRCYGKKEKWYLSKVPSGMLPAIELDNQLITESDEILLELERNFGPLGRKLEDAKTLDLRRLERMLFRAWCIWLCTPALTVGQEQRRQTKFQEVARQMERELQTSTGPWLDPITDSSGTSLPGSSDVVFIPYLERMNASLAYFKGFNLRSEHPAIHNWFKSLESLDVYRGTQGDFHTHAHDLPPQMGGCWFNSNPKQKQFSMAIDSGEGLGEMETSFSMNEESHNQRPEVTALYRVLKHRHTLLDINPLDANSFDQPLRAALTCLMTGIPCAPKKGSAVGLRYLKDRISVPRDMPLLSARKFRHALEMTAQIDGSTQGPKIQTRNRFDQDPAPFIKKKL